MWVVVRRMDIFRGIDRWNAAGESQVLSGMCCDSLRKRDRHALIQYWSVLQAVGFTPRLKGSVGLLITYECQYTDPLWPFGHLSSDIDPNLWPGAQTGALETVDRPAARIRRMPSMRL